MVLGIGTTIGVKALYDKYFLTNGSHVICRFKEGDDLMAIESCVYDIFGKEHTRTYDIYSKELAKSLGEDIMRFVNATSETAVK